MARTCPACGVENPDASKFCSECGAALADLTTPARKERKFATALFADLVDYTRLVEWQDPEVVESMVVRVFDQLTQEVERHGGIRGLLAQDDSAAALSVTARTIFRTVDGGFQAINGRLDHLSERVARLEGVHLRTGGASRGRPPTSTARPPSTDRPVRARAEKGNQ